MPFATAVMTGDRSSPMGNDFANAVLIACHRPGNSHRVAARSTDSACDRAAALVLCVLRDAPRLCRVVPQHEVFPDAVGKTPSPWSACEEIALEHTIGKFPPLSRGPSAHGLVPWGKPGPIPPPLGTSKSNRNTLPAGMGSCRGTIGPGFRRRSI